MMYVTIPIKIHANQSTGLQQETQTVSLQECVLLHSQHSEILRQDVCHIPWAVRTSQTSDIRVIDLTPRGRACR